MGVLGAEIFARAVVGERSCSYHSCMYLSRPSRRTSFAASHATFGIYGVGTAWHGIAWYLGYSQRVDLEALVQNIANCNAKTLLSSTVRFAGKRPVLRSAIVKL